MPLVLLLQTEEVGECLLTVNDVPVLSDGWLSRAAAVLHGEASHLQLPDRLPVYDL